LSAVARLESRESLNVPSCKIDDSSNVIRMDHFISTTPLFKLDLKRVRLFSKLSAHPTCADKPARFVCENRL